MFRGQIAVVIRSLHWLCACRNLKGKHRETLNRLRAYFHNNAHRMACDIYLEHGLPIASGVIEGAAAVSSKSAWGVPACAGLVYGACAVLDMLCVYLSVLLGRVYGVSYPARIAAPLSVICV